MTDDFYDRPAGWLMVTLGWFTVALTAVGTGAVGLSVAAGVICIWCARRWALARRKAMLLYRREHWIPIDGAPY